MTGENVASKIPTKVKRCLVAAVSEAGYLSISDYVRHAIKEKLLHDGFLKIEPDRENDEK
jgi:hypothetical protein